MKRSLQGVVVAVCLIGFYIISYRFSGVTLTPSGPRTGRLQVLGISLPSTPTVYSAYNKLYWPLLLYTARQKPPMLVTGEVRVIDFSARNLIVGPNPGQAVGCKFTSAHDSTLRAFKQGDLVSVSIGFVPHPKYPGSWSYTLLSIAPKE